MIKLKDISFSQIKNYGEEIVTLLMIVALSIALYLVGCGTTTFNYVPPTSCSDLEYQGLEDAVCSPPGEVGNIEGLEPTDYDCSDNPEECENNRGSDRNRDRTSGESDDAYIAFSNSYSMGKIDIIFVIDNSRSMYKEQQNIAGQFNKFLDAIDHLDYRIAIMTVDISDSPGNRDRYYQDGKFIRMGRDRLLYLENEDFADNYEYSQDENIEMFKVAIRREESLKCLDEERKCPDDERAICALNLSFDRSNQAKFFRPTGHLMVVIISDEDERSSQEYIDAQRRLYEKDYSLTACDDPYTFYRNIAQKVSKHKSVSVHSIIIPPDDDDCLDEQNDSNGRGYYGEVYEMFALPTLETRDKYPFVLDGQVISICKRNYGAQLGQLSDFAAEVQPIALPCIPHKVNHVRLKKENRSSSSRLDYRVEGRNIIIEASDIPLNSRVLVSVLCSKNSTWSR